MSLFWALISQDTETFANTLAEHKNKSTNMSKINVTIQYPTNKSFFSEDDIGTNFDISQYVYEEIQDNLEWSLKLPSYHDNISKHIDDYYIYREKNALISYLYDKEEEDWMNDTEYKYDDYTLQFNTHNNHEEYEEIEV